MTYYNPLFAYGIQRFVDDAVAAGIDGLIVPDLPPDEADEVIAACRAAGLATIFFIAPTSTEAPVPLSAYLENLGVSGAPVAPDKLTDLTVSLPTPPGWAPYSNPNLAPGTRVIAKGDTYPTAMLLVFQLQGDFDVKDALKHADGDAELSENFKRLNASDDNFRGFPSSMVEGR